MTALAIVLGVVMVALGYLFNHGLARMAFVELALSNEPRTTSGGIRRDAGSGAVTLAFSEDAAATALEADSISVFASNSCSTCIRLIDELGAPDVDLGDALRVYFSGTKPAIPVPGQWTDKAQDLFDTLSIPATPYVVVMSEGAVAAHGPVSTTGRFQGLLNQAGHSYQLPTRLLGALPATPAEAAGEVGT